MDIGIDGGNHQVLGELIIASQVIGGVATVPSPIVPVHVITGLHVEDILDDGGDYLGVPGVGLVAEDLVEGGYPASYSERNCQSLPVLYSPLIAYLLRGTLTSPLW